MDIQYRSGIYTVDRQMGWRVQKTQKWQEQSFWLCRYTNVCVQAEIIWRVNSANKMLFKLITIAKRGEKTNKEGRACYIISDICIAML